MAVLQYAAGTGGVYADCSTVANFVSWGSAISRALSTFGWAQQTTSGQVVWSSVSSVPAQNTIPLYQVWAMTDSLQATCPIYVMIWFGTVYGANCPALGIQVGTGYNGESLTGAGQALYVACNSSGGTSGSSAQFECDFSGDKNRFHMILFRGFTYPIYFSIERCHTPSGADSGSYATYFAGGYAFIVPNDYVGGSPYVWQQSLLLDPPMGNGPVEPGCITVQTSNTTAAVGQNVALSPFWPMVGTVGNPLLGALCCKSLDVTDGQQITTTMYGDTHNYLVSHSGFANWGNQENNATCIAMRYE